MEINVSTNLHSLSCSVYSVHQDIYRIGWLFADIIAVVQATNDN